MESCSCPCYRYFNNARLFLVLTLALLCFQMAGACYVQIRQSNISVTGYKPELMSHHVCLDNTIIHYDDPTRIPPEHYTFRRHCCGCRVSGAYVKEIELTTTSWPEERHAFYLTDIRECQCIVCDFEWNSYHRYLTELRI